MRSRWIWPAATSAALAVIFLAWLPHAQTPVKYQPPSSVRSSAPSADEEAGRSQDRRAAAPLRVYPQPALRPQHQSAAQRPVRLHLLSGTQQPPAATQPVRGGGPDSTGRDASGSVPVSGGGESAGKGQPAGEGRLTSQQGPAAEESSVAGGEPAAGDPPAAEAPQAALPASILTPPILLGHSASYPGDAYAVAVDRSLFTPELRLLASEGRVVIRVLVRADGAVGSVLVDQSSGNPALDRAVVEAAASWRFQPATRDGVAIDAWAVIPVRFVFP